MLSFRRFFSSSGHAVPPGFFMLVYAHFISSPPAMSTGLQFLVSGLKFLLVSLQCWLLGCFNFIGLAPLQLQFHWSTSTVISTFIALFWLHSFPPSCSQFCLDWILDSCDFQLVSGFTCPLASELVQFPFTSLDSPTAVMTSATASAIVIWILPRRHLYLATWTLPRRHLDFATSTSGSFSHHLILLLSSF